MNRSPRPDRVGLLVPSGDNAVTAQPPPATRLALTRSWLSAGATYHITEKPPRRAPRYFFAKCVTSGFCRYSA
jgi:hypothetical protein